MSGLSTRQRTMTRTSVNASSITLNFDSFPLCSGLSGPGDACIFLLWESEPGKMKASRRRRIRSLPGGRLSVSPARQVWLDASEGELSLQERIYANTRGRSSGRTPSGQKKNIAVGQRFIKRLSTVPFLALSEWKKIRPGGLIPERRRSAKCFSQVRMPHSVLGCWRYLADY